ncbi:DUF4259 domain-containing protein [Actinocrinis puniceicyclus]|uniref:DUF4259 domain-containing protein n=1 Tax=Actinocrinis puniceicyclus TaxID=977794 RepID=A0A8J7WPE2_9ACTN|nr:DUF4259 domain-containing protein [Actinocrinis puniceicyclus]MBS2963452.1 DUF4259 domain-containing protein [Actinocrinis puniceicyclus]
MGTWQVGPFDNDDAMDFFDEVEETPDSEVPPKLRETLVAVVERPGKVELQEGHVAVAAACLVAAGRSRAAATGNSSVDAWLTAHRPQVTAEDQRVALAALDRVTGPDSEWMALWANTPSSAALEERIASLRQVLNG